MRFDVPQRPALRRASNSRPLFLMRRLPVPTCGDVRARLVTWDVSAMRTLAVATLAALAFTGADAETTNSFDQVRQQAMAGDYQAQRNLAFGFSSAPYPGQAKNAIAACAWRAVILNSGHRRVDATDQNNFAVYCGQLSAEQQASARRQARELFRSIYGRDLDAPPARKKS